MAQPIVVTWVGIQAFAFLVTTSSPYLGDRQLDHFSHTVYAWMDGAMIELQWTVIIGRPRIFANWPVHREGTDATDIVLLRRV